VIGIVIRHQESLPQERLTVPPREGRKEVTFRVLDQSNHLFQVLAKAGQALLPRRIRGWSRLGRPIPLGPVGAHILRIPTEFQDVPLTDPDVLQELPEGMGNSFGPEPLGLGGHILEDILQAPVGSPTLQQVDQVIPKGYGFAHG
jgi:hypothetical protein